MRPPNVPNMIAPYVLSSAGIARARGEAPAVETVTFGDEAMVGVG